MQGYAPGDQALQFDVTKALAKWDEKLATRKSRITMITLSKDHLDAIFTT
jgi:hypothetical protein